MALDDSSRNPFKNRKLTLFGLDSDQLIKTFFGGNALIAIVVLLLITIFLFKEGVGFFGQNHENLKLYRRSGLEYVNHMRKQVDDYTALARFLNDIRLEQFKVYQGQGLSHAEINERLADFDAFIERFDEDIYPIQDYVGELKEFAMDIREQALVYKDDSQLKADLLAANKAEEAAEIQLIEPDYVMLEEILREGEADYAALLDELKADLLVMPKEIPVLDDVAQNARLERFKGLLHTFILDIDKVKIALSQWDPNEAVPFRVAFSSFIFGREWISNSYFQDWYGILPLFTGSLLVAMIALVIAVPFGVSGAVYVNQIASVREQKLIKPYIEFISAIPSVVIGFFGVAVLGQGVRWLSQTEYLSWLPFFPISERLNAFTAGVLLALMAIPTIFSLAEDALNNVPRAFKEASYSMGATRFQTIVRIIVPTALSGIISAILLGFGRVIGETMVVLLCAGNRIRIPGFSEGLGVLFQPVHTMTGIIAQEMGEVVRDSLHYRALFLVGMVLFVVSLLINYMAQKVVRKYKISVN